MFLWFNTIVPYLGLFYRSAIIAHCHHISRGRYNRRDEIPLDYCRRCVYNVARLEYGYLMNVNAVETLSLDLKMLRDQPF